MRQKLFNFLAAIVFTAVFVVHVLRVVNNWDAVIDGWPAPMWISYVGLIVTGVLAQAGFRLTRSKA